MTVGLYRLAMPDGSVRLARGRTDHGPTELLDAGPGHALPAGAILLTGTGLIEVGARRA
jgi:hypothetical protein